MYTATIEGSMHYTKVLSALLQMVKDTSKIPHTAFLSEASLKTVTAQLKERTNGKMTKPQIMGVPLKFKRGVEDDQVKILADQ